MDNLRSFGHDTCGEKTCAKMIGSYSCLEEHSHVGVIQMWRKHSCVGVTHVWSGHSHVGVTHVWDEPPK